MTDVTMPKLSDSMEEGTILTWLKQDGEEISPGDDLVEIETDKAVMTVHAEVGGLLRITVDQGETVVVGCVIAQIGTETRPADGHETQARAHPVASSSNGGGHPGRGAPPPPLISSAARATPLARRAARLHGVVLEELSGSGPGGRITRADVLAAAGPPGASSRPLVADAESDAGGVEQLSRIQQLIARRMTESKTTIPEFEVQTEVRMDALIETRNRLRELAGEGPTVTINDMIIKACALALRRHPRVNASYGDEQLIVRSRLSIGIAVARPDALVVPVIHDADTASLGAIAAESLSLAARVRAGKVTLEELSGATFTVSNLGMYGMTAIRPVIDPPQVAILGVGAIRPVLAKVDGEVVERAVMTLSLIADHRALYGADAARFLSDVRGFLEVPVGMLL
jgi:pyruvate dehydrogenase E2 component (dihydrolipoyllysine-residue acetyltransferase)